MKRIRKSRAARIIGWLLTVAMITPLVCQSLRPQAALAQSASAAGGMQTVVVVDFANKSGVPGELLARTATDAVAVELGNSARFDPLRRDEVDRQARDLNLKKPYDMVAMSKLAGALSATGIVTGEIVAVKPGPKTGPKCVSVWLKVGILEASSGQLTSGAAQIGVAYARAGVTDTDELAQEAANNAANLAVKQILQTVLPEGTIISSVGAGRIGTDLNILVNKGSRDGVGEGMQMLVLRDRQRVGKIAVTAVYATDSEAKVLENTLGIRPEDKVRAIFPMPDFPSVAGFKSVTRKTPTNGGSSVAALGKLLVVLLVGGVVVAAVAGGKNSTTTAVVAEATTLNGAPAVRVTYRDNMWGSTTLEHQIWREPDYGYNFQGTPVAALTGFMYTDLASPWSYWDGTKGFRQAATGGTGNNNNGGAGDSEVVTPDAGAVPGFTPGNSYNYGVNAIIRRPVSTSTSNNNNNGTGGTTETEDVSTEPVRSGQVTPVIPSILSSPQDMAVNVDLAKFNPTWNSTRGADVFVVEVSTDRTFKNKAVLVQLPMVYSTAVMTQGVAQTLPASVDLTALDVLKRDATFANYVNRVAGSAKPTLYWRIGARNDADRPGPVDWITSSAGNGDRTYRWVYTGIRSFTPADMPPPPP